jgi:hypothetical protein
MVAAGNPVAVVAGNRMAADAVPRFPNLLECPKGRSVS